MEEKGLQNKSILGNEIQLQDSETENKTDSENGDFREADIQAELEYVNTYSGRIRQG